MNTANKPSVFLSWLRQLFTKRLLFRLGIAGIVTIIISAVLFLFVDVSSIMAALRNVSFLSIFLGFMLYVIGTVCRAYRFFILTPCLSGSSGSTLFSITSIHTFFNNILPLRSGEAALPILLKQCCKTPITSSIALLVLARLFDLVAILLIMVLSAAMTVEFADPFLRSVIVTVIILVFIIMAVLVLFLSSSSRVLGTLSSWAKKLFPTSKAVWFLLRKLNELVKAISILKVKHYVVKALALSILIWVSTYAAAYVVVTDMGLHLPFLVVMLGFALSTLASALPVHGIAGFGTLEVGWAIIFVALGAARETAISSGFGFHVVLLAYSAVLFGVGAVWLMVRQT